MGIDKFINDYFDGTLSPEDDKEFRDLLENDVNAQEEFDLMLSIHSILKEDAESITIPRQLQERVEQRVLATYLNIVSSKGIRNSRRFAYALALLVFFFFFSVFNIDDGKIVSNRSFFVSEILKQSSFLENKVPNLIENESPSIQNTKYSLRRTLAQNEKLNTQNNFVATVETSSLQETFNPQKLITITDGIKNKEEMVLNFDDFGKPKTFFNSISQNSLFSNYLGHTTLVRAGRIIIDNSHILANELPTQGIALTGFSSIPLKKYGYNKENLKSFSSFSQSLGYKIADNIRLGLEFGYFDFDYVQNTTILVPAINSPAPERKIYLKNIDGKGNDALILQNGEDNKYPTYVKVTVPIERKYQHYWGSLFVDYEYPLTKSISLVSRVNVGATNEGFLGGVRVFTEIQPLWGVSFNIGFENKSYWSRIQNEASSMKSIFSIVYGLSIKFNFDKRY